MRGLSANYTRGASPIGTGRTCWRGPTARCRGGKPIRSRSSSAAGRWTCPPPRRSRGTASYPGLRAPTCAGAPSRRPPAARARGWGGPCRDRGVWSAAEAARLAPVDAVVVGALGARDGLVLGERGEHAEDDRHARLDPHVHQARGDRLGDDLEVRRLALDEHANLQAEGQPHITAQARATTGWACLLVGPSGLPPSVAWAVPGRATRRVCGQRTAIG